MPTEDRSWFERKVRELGDVLRRLPRSRRRQLVDAQTGNDSEACHGTGGRLDGEEGESVADANKGGLGRSARLVHRRIWGSSGEPVARRMAHRLA